MRAPSQLFIRRNEGNRISRLDDFYFLFRIPPHRTNQKIPATDRHIQIMSSLVSKIKALQL